VLAQSASQAMTREAEMSGMKWNPQPSNKSRNLDATRSTMFGIGITRRCGAAAGGACRLMLGAAGFR
jgi:hypothetical protein